MASHPPPSTLFPYTTLFRSSRGASVDPAVPRLFDAQQHVFLDRQMRAERQLLMDQRDAARTIADRKRTRLNSSHLGISYAVFCLKKKRFNAYVIRLRTQTSR